MRPRVRIRIALAVALAAGAAGCASTHATEGQQYGGRLPRPDRIVVYRFATSPDEVTLDQSPTAVAAWKLQGISASSERQQVARSVADAVADNLVSKLRAQGYPAEIGEGPITGEGRVLAISGQFLSIDEGNRALRMTIGLGAGRSDVVTSVQVVELFAGGRRLVDQFEIDAKSGRKPGAAETMGVGAAAGTVATAAVATAATAIGSEAFGADVQADAKRTADKVAIVLADFFARQGW
jgi:hypothetical protein